MRELTLFYIRRSSKSTLEALALVPGMQIPVVGPDEHAERNQAERPETGSAINRVGT